MRLQEATKRPWKNQLKQLTSTNNCWPETSPSTAKNELVSLQLVKQALANGVLADYVLFDSWYSHQKCSMN